MRIPGPIAALVLFAALALFAAPSVVAQPRQTEADGYTRYELLAPGSGRFRILYEVSATTPGATAYYNPIRVGSVATDERVVDRATGRPLRFEEVSGDVARAGGIADAEPGSRYIRVALARPVPAQGEARVLIDKTYTDARSYYREGATIVFDRSLGVKRNAVVLPPNYELLSSNWPAQVLREADGRIRIAFWNDTPAPAPLVLKARPLAAGALPDTTAAGPDDGERAHQNREIVYYLEQPETHAFALTHDYTESRPGTDRYVNIVRAGSRVSDPSARNLDTGAVIPDETLRGQAVLQAEPTAAGVTAQTEAVVFRFPAVRPGESLRLRIAETYTDPASYKLDGDTLVWRRALGRPANAVVLPQGWYLTGSTIPATTGTLPDGRMRLDFINPRPGDIDVQLTASRRPN